MTEATHNYIFKKNFIPKQKNLVNIEKPSPKRRSQRAMISPISPPGSLSSRLTPRLNSYQPDLPNTVLRTENQTQALIEERKSRNEEKHPRTRSLSRFGRLTQSQSPHVHSFKNSNVQSQQVSSNSISTPFSGFNLIKMDNEKTILPDIGTRGQKRKISTKRLPINKPNF